MSEPNSDVGAEINDDDAWDCSSATSSLSSDTFWLDADISQSTDTPFIPEYLDASACEIRLLRIRPAWRLEDSLVVDRVWSSLHSDPEYEALSYTWGAPPVAESARVNGFLQPITNNLAAALRRLRKQDVTRTLWIDALCINQSNDVERTEQVLLMTQIYSKASRVVVWLGDSHVPWRVADSFADHRSCEISDDLRLEHHKQRSLLDALKHTDPSWWERVWILQEAIFAASDPVFTFGPYDTTWTQLERMLGLTKNPFAVGLMTGLESLRRFQRRLRLHGIGMLEAVKLTKAFNASDVRDKIYGLLGLLRPEFRNALQPDYTASCASVFRRALLVFVMEHQSFELFAAFYPAESPDDSSPVTSDSSSPALGSVPNWVSALCRDPQVRPTNHGINPKWILWSEGSPRRATMWDEVPSIQLTERQNGGPILRCKGRFFDTLQATADFENLSKWNDVAAQAIQKAATRRLADISSMTIQGAAAPNSDFRALLDPNFRLKHDLRADKDEQLVVPGIQPCDNMVSSLGQGKPALDINLADLRWYWLEYFIAKCKEWPHCSDRSTFYTESGFVGVAPARVRQGDVVALVDNTYIPAILRPNEGYYEFCCYSFIPAVWRTAQEIRNKALPTEAYFRPMEFLIG